jgi:type II secretory pathway pseudopilin PulG
MRSNLRRNKFNAILKRRCSAISPVISAVILTSILLVILIIAAFVSGNILEMRVQNTEFEQAKTNMMLLDEIIEEAGMKQGAGSYVQFNLNSGALSIIKGDNMTINITNIPSFEPITFTTLTFVYKSGGFVSSSNSPLRGEDSPIVNGTGVPLGYLRIENKDGVAQIKLDYNRVKVINFTDETGEYNVLQIIFFKVVKAESRSMGGSGLLRISAQNKGVQINSYGAETTEISVKVKVGSVETTKTFSFNNSYPVAVIVVESVVEVSLS